MMLTVKTETYSPFLFYKAFCKIVLINYSQTIKYSCNTINKLTAIAQFDFQKLSTNFHTRPYINISQLYLIKPIKLKLSLNLLYSIKKFKGSLH